MRKTILAHLFDMAQDIPENYDAFRENSYYRDAYSYLSDELDFHVSLKHTLKNSDYLSNPYNRDSKSSIIDDVKKNFDKSEKFKIFRL